LEKTTKAADVARKDGEKILISAKSWPDYEAEWPYRSVCEIEKAFFEGILNVVNNEPNESQKIEVSIKALDLKFIASKAWMRRWGKTTSLSSSDVVITKQLVKKYEPLLWQNESVN
jgi:hypothetical protein